MLTLEIQYTFNTKVCSTTVLVWLHSILWNSFRLLLLSRKWLNADDCCVMIVICMFYCDIYRRHCLLVLLKCKKRLIIIFSNYVMLEPNGRCVNMTAFCIIVLFRLTFYVISLCVFSF